MQLRHVVRMSEWAVYLQVERCVGVCQRREVCGDWVLIAVWGLGMGLGLGLRG